MLTGGASYRDTLIKWEDREKEDRDDEDEREAQRKGSFALNSAEESDND